MKTFKQHLDEASAVQLKRITTLSKDQVKEIGKFTKNLIDAVEEVLFMSTDMSFTVKISGTNVDLIFPSGQTMNDLKQQDVGINNKKDLKQVIDGAIVEWIEDD